MEVIVLSNGLMISAYLFSSDQHQYSIREISVPDIVKVAVGLGEIITGKCSNTRVNERSILLICICLNVPLPFQLSYKGSWNLTTDDFEVSLLYTLQAFPLHIIGSSSLEFLSLFFILLQIIADTSRWSEL
jgi:hypothetical protein